MKDLNNIKLIVLDVDGTMTDGGVYIDNNGVESKKFSIKDGAGIKLAEAVGIDFMILTGRKSRCVEQRAQELNIKYIEQNVIMKGLYLKGFMESEGFDKEEVAYIGDDLNDMPAMACVGIKACPIDASEEVKSFCDIVLEIKGGDGVVRAFVDMLLKSTNRFEIAQRNLYPLA